MNQRIGPSITLAGICIAASFLLYIPQLETFKAFTVEVRLRQSLDRAEEILARLKELSVISAKVTYMTMAWGNRIGAPSAKDKQAILDEVDAQLSVLKVSDAERGKITEPLTQLIGADLYFIYIPVFERFIMWKQNDLERRTIADQNPGLQLDRQKLANEPRQGVHGASHRAIHRPGHRLSLALHPSRI
jgi:hypothetical protein